MQQNNIDITLDATIDPKQRLVICASDESGQVQLDPLDPLGTLLVAYGEASSLTLRVHDFQQGDALYRVHAATLDQDGESVLARWQPIEGANGQTYTFTREDLSVPGQRIFIGATPCGQDVPEPQAFAPGSRTGVPAPGDPTGDPDEDSSGPK